LGGNITALVIGNNCNYISERASKIEGINQVLEHQIESPNFIPETYEEIILNLQKNEKFTHILSTHNTFGKQILPKLGGKLDVQPISDVMGIESPSKFLRPIYAGNALCLLESKDTIKILTIRATNFERAKNKENEKSQVKEIKYELKNTNLPKFISKETSKSDRPELTSAKIIVSGGRGLKDEANFKILYELADKLGAAVGATRAVCDAGIAPSDLQIGQTGKNCCS